MTFIDMKPPLSLNVFLQKGSILGCTQYGSWAGNGPMFPSKRFYGGVRFFNAIVNVVRLVGSRRPSEPYSHPTARPGRRRTAHDPNLTHTTVARRWRRHSAALARWIRASPFHVAMLPMRTRGFYDEDYGGKDKTIHFGSRRVTLLSEHRAELDAAQFYLRHL
jgi:hypothetical protein